MAAVEQGQMQQLIHEAQGRVAMQGMEASDKEIMLAGFGWLAGQIFPLSPNGRPRRGGVRQTVLQYGPPAGVAGVVLAICLGVLQAVLWWLGVTP